MKFLAPVHLDRAHEPYLAKFDCGDASLTVWLQTRAVSNEEKKASRTYLVFTDTGDLAGFFSICANVFEHNLMSAASRRNKPDPIPDAAMLDLAVTISRRIAELCGAVFVAVHPISESAAKFYSHYGFKAAKAGGSLLIFRL